MVKSNFDVLLTVHCSIILVIWLITKVQYKFKSDSSIYIVSFTNID